MRTGTKPLPFSLEEKMQQKLFMMEEPGFSEICGVGCKFSYLILFPSLYALILQAVAGSDWSRLVSTRPDLTRLVSTSPDRTRMVSTRPNWSIPVSTSPDWSPPDQTDPDWSPPDQTEPDQCQPEQSRPDQSQPDQNGLDWTRPVLLCPINIQIITIIL